MGNIISVKGDKEVKGKPLVPWAMIAIAGIILMLSLSFQGLSASKADEEGEGEAEEIVIEDPIAAGEEIYKKTCVGCHGDNYDQMPQAPLNQFTADDKDLIIETVTKGRGGMPAFGNQFQPVQIDAIAEFLISVSQ